MEKCPLMQLACVGARKDKTARSRVITARAKRTRLSKGGWGVCQLLRMRSGICSHIDMRLCAEGFALQCFLLRIFSLFLCTERIDERNIKASTAASKARPTTFEGAWVFFIRKCRNAAGSAGQSTQKCKFCRHFGSV